MVSRNGQLSRRVRSALDRLPRTETPGLEELTPTPTVRGFNWRRTDFGIRTDELDQGRRNGIGLDPLATTETVDEQDYLKWLLDVGISVQAPSGSRPEYQVYRALERQGLRAPESDPFPGFDFQFQVPLFPGGALAIADFVIWRSAPTTVIRVQGEYFHFKDIDAVSTDIVQRLALEAEGYRVIDVLAQDTVPRGRVDYVVGLALQGMEVDTTGKVGAFR